MRSVRSIMGLPVIHNGEKVGRVSGVKLSRDLARLQGVWVDTGFAGGRFVDEGEIDVLGDVSVLTRDGGRREKCGEKPRFRRAVSASGQRLGAITDAFVDEDSRDILAVELSSGFLDDLIRGRQRISQFSVCPDGDIVVEEPREGEEES